MTNAATVTLADVIVTHELDQRPAPGDDHSPTKQAILELAARVADGPEQVLPRFVDLAMEITGGVASGISIAESAVFRWAFLRGSLAAFEGATTPRNFSPCGMTLDADSPVLCRHAERYYDWIAEANIVVPEVMLVPLHRGSEQLGTLWIVSDRVGHFHRGHVAAITDLASFVSTALQMHQAEQQLKAALAEQQMLTREMSHRLKNVFGMVDGMIKLSAGSAGSAELLAAALSGRVRALAAAHGLIRRSFSDQPAVAEVADLEALLRAVLQPHEAVGGKPPRFVLRGSRVALGESAINGLALVFHELATNSFKYGALTTSGGVIEIAWDVVADNLDLRWREQGGPSVAGPPSAAGFGTRLVRQTIERTLGGTMRHDWTPDGVQVELHIPRDRLKA